MKHQFENYDRFNLHTYLPITEVPSVLDNDDKMYIGTYEGTLQLDLKKLQKAPLFHQLPSRKLIFVKMMNFPFHHLF